MQIKCTILITGIVILLLALTVTACNFSHTKIGNDDVLQPPIKTVEDLSNPNYFDYWVALTINGIVIGSSVGHGSENDFSVKINCVPIFLRSTQQSYLRLSGEYNFNPGQEYLIEISATIPSIVNESTLITMPQEIILDLPDKLEEPIEFKWSMYPNNSIDNDFLSLGIETLMLPTRPWGYIFQITPSTRSAMVPLGWVPSYDDIYIYGNMAATNYAISGRISFKSYHEIYFAYDNGLRVQVDILGGNR